MDARSPHLDKLLPQIQQLPILPLRKQDPRLLETLPYRGAPIGLSVGVPRGVIWWRDLPIMEVVEVAAGKDVRRGEGGAFYAVEEKYFVLGRKDDNTVLSVSCSVLVGKGDG